MLEATILLVETSSKFSLTSRTVMVSGFSKLCFFNSPEDVERELKRYIWSLYWTTIANTCTKFNEDECLTKDRIRKICCPEGPTDAKEPTNSL
ncbi:hypothetical protein B9Z55_027298 [Caenorhabditis nigoni]|nr:hypothetical protein B9Z55_027298 [Caenorhabditis nigoni]